MRSNRTLVSVLLVALVLAGVIGWQAFASPEPLAPPAEQGEDAGAGANPERDTIKPSEAAATSGGSAVARTEVGGGDPSASNLPSIVGQVVGPDGQPVVGAEVVCREGAGFAANFEDFEGMGFGQLDPESLARRVRERLRNQVVVATDAQGWFRARVEGTRSKVGIRVLMRGYLALEQSVARPVDEDTDVGVLQLKAGAVIMGRVVDAVGNAVVGARVSRISEVERAMGSNFDVNLPGSELFEGLRQGTSSVTDAEGRFELAHAVAGDFTLRARHRDYPTGRLEDQTAFQGQVVSGVLIQLPAAGEIRGVVQGLPAKPTGVVVMAAKKQEAKEGAGGLANLLGDASDLFGDIGMSFGERECEIGADGSFVLKGLRTPQNYRVWLAQKGEGFAVAGVCSKPQEAPAGSSVVLQYEPGASVTFTVVDDKTGKPVERMWVRQQLVGGGGLNVFLGMQARVAREAHYPGGVVTLAHLRPKEKQKLGLSINAHGYADFDHADVKLPKTGVVDLGTIRLEAAPVMHVTVLGSDERPLAGALVSLSKSGGRPGVFPIAGTGPATGRSGRDGRCTVNFIEGEDCTLSVTHKGFAPSTVAVPADGPGVREQRVQLLVGGSVLVTVRASDGTPAKMVTVAHRTSSGKTDRKTTDDEGVAQFHHLAPGKHEFRLGKKGLLARMGRANRGSQEQWDAVEVQDEQEASLVIEKAPSAALTGIVRQNGVVLEGASVHFVSGPVASKDEDPTARLLRGLQRGGGRSAKTDEAGAYELFEMPSGEHHLRITHKDRAMDATVAVRLFDGDNRCDVELTTATLFGVVRDGQGQPVAGARISVAVKTETQGDAREFGNLMAGMMRGRGAGGNAPQSNQNGEFTLHGVRPDVPLTVVAEKAGLAPATTVATVALGQRHGPLELQLQAAGKILVTVAKAQTFATVRAKWVGQGAQKPVIQMLRKGKATLDSLRPGTWEVTYLTMAARGKGAPKQTVEVVAGETKTVSF